MFIFSPSEAEKQPREPKIVFLIGKLTNEWSTLLFLILPHIQLVPVLRGATNAVSTDAGSTD